MYKVITGDFVKVSVTNSLTNAVAIEQKFAKDLLIEDLKVNNGDQLAWTKTTDGHENEEN